MNEEKIPGILLYLANSQLLPIFISVFVGFPSAILYLIQIILIIKHNKNRLQSSFLALCAARGIASLIGYVVSFLHQRIPRLGYFLPLYLELPRFCLVLIYFLVNYNLFVEYFATAVLSLDRLIAIAFPFDYEQAENYQILKKNLLLKKWKKTLILLILAIFILPFAFLWPIFGLDEYVRIQDDGTFTIDTHYRNLDSSTRNAFISAIVFTLICLSINIISMIILRCSKSNSTAAGLSQIDIVQKQIERKMRIYALVTFFGQYIYSTYLIILYITSNEIEHWGINPQMAQLIFLAIFNQVPWVYDLCFICIPAWLLLWAHKLLRAQILGMFKCKFSIGSVRTSIRQAWNQS